MDLTIYCNDVTISAYSSGRTEVNLNNIENEMEIVKQLIRENGNWILNDILDTIGWDYIKEYYDINEMIEEAIEMRKNES